LAGQGGNIQILTSCSTSASNSIRVLTPQGDLGDFSGPVECSSQGGGNNTTQESTSSMASGSSQDSDSDEDGDGIPDSSDRCTHDSNPRCYKEDTA